MVRTSLDHIHPHNHRHMLHRIDHNHRNQHHNHLHNLHNHHHNHQSSYHHLDHLCLLVRAHHDLLLPLGAMISSFQFSFHQVQRLHVVYTFCQ